MESSLDSTYEIRKRAAENALASVRIEGLEPCKEYMNDIGLYVKGEITMDEVLKRIKERG